MIALARLLGDSMGSGPGLATPRPIVRPLARALTLLALFLLLWGAIDVVAAATGAARGHEPRLYAMLAWAGGYGVLRAFLAEVATAQVFATVASDIVPYASPAYLEAVAEQIERRRTFPRRVAWPVLLGAMGAVASYLVLRRELNMDDFFRSPEWLFGMVIYSASFVVSVRSVGAARFHLSFAKCLDEERDALYLLGAADSPLVEGLAKLGAQILLFWAAVFLVILSILMLAVPWLGGYGLKPNSPFLMILVPVMVFLTLGIGSLVYLRSEARIRETLRRFTLRQAAVLQQQINALLDPVSGRTPDDPDELGRLADWHDRILAGGRYGSPAGTAISIALPFLLPAASLIKSLFDSMS